VKCINLNYENSKVINFTAHSSMILEEDTPLHVYNPKKIKHKHCGAIVLEPEIKVCRERLGVSTASRSCTSYLRGVP
jgi:hypothetical protein